MAQAVLLSYVAPVRDLKSAMLVKDKRIIAGGYTVQFRDVHCIDEESYMVDGHCIRTSMQKSLHYCNVRN